MVLDIETTLSEELLELELELELELLPNISKNDGSSPVELIVVYFVGSGVSVPSLSFLIT